MRAVVLERPAPIEQNPLALVDRDEPSAGDGEIVVKVSACGVCRSNLHMIEGDWVDGGVPAFTPIIPGHEVVGRVAELGAGVTTLAVGDRVGVQPLWSTCGHCEFCLTGRDQLCPSKHLTGETVDGGYAEYMVAEAAHAYLVPPSIGDAEAAPLFCPGITAFGAVAKARLSPARSLAVFGVGGVGHMVLQLGALHGGDVVAVSRGAQHLELARELGATRTIDASAGDASDVLRADGGVDASIVCAPSSAVLAQAIRSTKAGGVVIVIVNAEVGPLPFAEEKIVVGSILGSRRQMQQVLEIAGAGKIRAVCDEYALSDATEALTRLKRGEIRARAVLMTER